MKNFNSSEDSHYPRKPISGSCSHLKASPVKKELSHPHNLKSTDEAHKELNFVFIEN